MFETLSRQALTVGLAVSLLGVAAAQDIPTVDPLSPESWNVSEPALVPGSYIVHFETRSFDLDAYRAAIHGKASADEVARIVKRMEDSVQSDQAAFVRSVEALGGAVEAQWWIINAAAVSGIHGKAVDQLAKLDNVLRLEQEKVYPLANNTSRNSAHHEADQANQRRNASNALVDGAGVTVAILDTGVDAQYSGSTPNPGYFIGGNTSNTSGGGIAGSRLRAVFGTSGFGTEDQHGHGTHVSGSSASGNPSFRGMAPNASVVGVKISNDGGSAASNWLVSGWQTVASQRAAHNIVAANNSFSGSPSLTDSIQMALDNTAFNADVLISCAAGNGGNNTASSQNAWNGLAVGSLDKNSLAVSSFSGKGPLDNFGRTYPDISAVGRSVVSMARNSTGGATSSGTSMASPMVCGGAALVRQADPAITALEAKAILLNATKHTQNSRNTYGLGMMDCDASVALALSGDFFTTQMTGSTTVVKSFTASSTGAFSITATWMHPAGSRFDNIDMRVYAGATLVASDLNTLNSYESVDFNVQAGRSYRVELSRVGSVVRNTLDIAVAGFSDAPAQSPTLSAISPSRIGNYLGGVVTLTGTFDRIGSVTVGGAPVASFTEVSPTQLTFQLPIGFTIADSQSVVVSNTGGSSNALSLDVTGTHPAQIAGGPFAVRNNPLNITFAGDQAWQMLLAVSPSNQPSVIPGIVNLGIGSGFQLLLTMPTTVALDNGGAGSMPVILPATAPAGNYYFQGIHFDPNNLVAPLEVSNVLAVRFF